MDARKVSNLILAVLFAAAIPAWASLATDPDAYFDGTNTWQGSVALDNIAGISASVEFAVFEGDTYNLNYAGDLGISVTGDYVYAYQILVNSQSTIPLDFYSVGIDPQVSVADVHLNPFAGIAGGIQTQFQSALSASVLYVFSTGIDGNTNPPRSTVMVFSSDDGPTNGFGVISSGFFAGQVDGIPSPVPEPATMALLISGAAMSCHGFTRKK